ncbi:MAG: hypothetical protein IKV03_04135 [Alphaproteobacteria bacterium]|nr:hypothetical protein [Alphaproteobacteria bacterium]
MKKLSVFIFILFFSVGFTYKYYTYSPIPKIIHYVWLGKHPLPDSVHKIIKTWKKNAPDYQIMRWDEKNCDIDANHYVKWAYKKGLWSFASDWCRFNALYKYGGLYLDTDHELTQDPSHLFRHTQLVMTYEEKKQLSGSFIAAAKGLPFIKKVIQYYQKIGPSRLGVPTHLTTLYNTHFTPPLNGLRYTSKTLSLLPTNIAMIDFGGNENVAIHHYAGTDTIDKNRNYYQYFTKLFLKQISIHVYINNTKHQLILSDNQNGYFYKTNTKVKIIEKTDTNLIIETEGKKYHLYLKKDGFYPEKF